MKIPDPWDPDAPHTPNADTRKAIEEAIAGVNLEPVTIDDIIQRLTEESASHSELFE